MIEYRPKSYFNNGRTLQWGQNIPHEKMISMDSGEMFILLENDETPYSLILKDSYGTIREKRIYNKAEVEKLGMLE